MAIFNFEDFLNEKKNNWMKDAFKEKTKGNLHKKLGIPEDEKIPMSVINDEIKKLEAEKEKNGKYTKSQLKFFRELNLAKTAKKINKKK